MAGRTSARHADKPVVRTGGEVFSDGSIVELIRTSDGELSLLHWDGKTAETAKQFVRHSETFVPLPLDPTMLRSLQLPSHTAEYGSTRKLFTEMCNLTSRVTRLGDLIARAVTFALFATWLSDCLPFAPFLWIVTPPTTTAAPLVQLLRILARRALVVDISLLRFQSLPMELQPTLLIEVFEPTRRVLNLLRGSTRHGTLIAARGKAVDPYCAKIVFAREPVRDPTSAGFPLELVLAPTCDYVPLLSPSEAECIAAEYQAKLLHYRLVNRSKVRTPAFDLSQFTTPMQEVAHCLAASIVDDVELQAQIVPLLKPLDSEIRVNRASLLPAIVLEGLLARCHSTTGKYFRVLDLTVDVNTVLSGRGETLEVSPETVGWTLRALGLHTTFIPGGRKGLVLLNDTRTKIHDLAAAYGVRTLRELPDKPDCPFCAGLALPRQSPA